MAFTGSATIKVVSGNKVRITGLSLGAGAAGTIGLSNSATANVKLPAACKWHAYKNGENEEILPVDAIECTVAKAATDAHAVVIYQTKAGTAPGGADFLLTLTNADGTNAGPALEINLEYAI